MAKRKKPLTLQEMGINALLVTGFILGLMVFVATDSFFLLLLTVLSPVIVIRLIRWGLNVQKEQRYKQSGIQEIDKMDGHQFEYYLSVLLKNDGYKTSVTKGSHDYGCDLILKKDGQKIAVQAKRYKGKVGINAVQEITTARNYFNASEAWVITNSSYTKNAQEIAKANDVELMDREELQRLVIRITNETSDDAPSAQNIRYSVDPKSMKCPVCHNEMKLRKSKHGEFYGCVKYPACKGTKSVV